MNLSVRNRILLGYGAVILVFLVSITWDQLSMGSAQGGRHIATWIGAFIAIAVAFVVGISQARWITGKLSELKRDMGLAGLGDLTITAPVNAVDELGELSAAFNVMVARQVDLVGQGAEVAIALAASSEELAASSEEVTASVTDISLAMNKVAQEAEEGTRAITETSQVLLELSSLIQIAK